MVAVEAEISGDEDHHLHYDAQASTKGLKTGSLGMGLGLAVVPNSPHVGRPSQEVGWSEPMQERQAKHGYKSHAWPSVTTFQIFIDGGHRDAKDQGAEDRLKYDDPDAVGVIHFEIGLGLRDHCRGDCAESLEDQKQSHINHAAPCHRIHLMPAVTILSVVFAE